MFKLINRPDLWRERHTNRYETNHTAFDSIPCCIGKLACCNDHKVGKMLTINKTNPCVIKLAIVSSLPEKLIRYTVTFLCILINFGKHITVKKIFFRFAGFYGIAMIQKARKSCFWRSRMNFEISTG